MSGEPDLVSRFAEFGTSEAFSEAVEKFMSSHCAGFESYAPDAEQKLEWTECFKEYHTFVDKELEQFCKKEGVSTQDVSDAVQKWLADQPSGQVGFVPEFILNTDYSTFAAQLHELALSQHTHEKAAKAASGALSGLWRCTPELKADDDGMENFLKALECPYVFRKILVKASGYTRNISLTVDQGGVDGDTLTAVYTLKFFGTNRQVIKLDGQKHPTKNMWRQPVMVSGCIEKDGSITTEGSGHKGVPEGSVTKNRMYVEDGLLHIRHRAEVVGKEPVEHVLRLEPEK